MLSPQGILWLIIWVEFDFTTIFNQDQPHGSLYRQ